jgi:magnesium transporter
MAIIDNAIYRDGVRIMTPASMEETFEHLHDERTMAWIGLYRPSDAEIDAVAAEFDLHPLAVEDAKKGHQRPKIERYGDTLFTVLRPARYDDASETVEFGEVHVFTGPRFVVTIRHAESPNLGAVRKRMEAAPDLLALGSEAVLYAILDQVVDEYLPVTLGVENDLDEIDDTLFSGESDITRRIYLLASEIVSYQRAVTPLPGIIEVLQNGFEKYQVAPELQSYLRDVHDHSLTVVERTHEFRQHIQNALSTHHTLVGQEQNREMQRLSEVSLRQGEEVKKISSWAAIIFAPTLIAGIYGMNFSHMPELDWIWGYPMALGIMFGFAGMLYLIFKKKNWL